MSIGPQAIVEPEHAGLTLAGVRRTFGATEVLRGIDLEVAPKECVALIGANGAGKTTMLAVAAGDLAPDAGRVRVGGLDPHGHDASASRRRIAYVRDAALFYPDLTVVEQVILVALAHGVGRNAEQRADDALDAFALAERRAALPDQLSAGMRQRLLLACAFVRPFSVLLLDEPTRALDPAGRRRLADHLRDVRDAGAAIVLATHHIAFAGDLIDRVVLLEDGAVVADGRPGDVRDTPAARRLGVDPST